MVEDGKCKQNEESCLTVKEAFGDIQETGRPKFTVTTQEMLEDNENYITQILEKALHLKEQERGKTEWK